MTSPGPPVPVPSKAAIRALRGLVLGTTCSLALVAEDRRRRINAANLAVRHARTIRSASRYHAREDAISALAVPPEDEGSVSVVRWRHIEDNIRSTIMSTLQPANNTHQHTVPSANAAALDSIEGLAVPHQKPNTRHVASAITLRDSSPTSHAPSLQPTPQSTSRPRPRAPTTPCTTRWYIPHGGPSISDKAQKYQGWKRVAQESATHNTRPPDGTPEPQQPSPRPEDRIMVEALLRTLARTCHEATKEGGVQITDEVQEAIDTAEMISLMPATDADSENDTFAKRFSRLVTRFVALLSLSASTRTADELVDAGQALLTYLFALRHEPCVEAVYVAIAQYPGRMSWFTNWYLQQLEQHGYHSLLVASFLLRPPPADSLPTPLAYATLCSRVVQAVRANYNQDADLVFRALLATRPPASRLDTPWFTDLIYGHWTRTRRYEEARGMFDGLTKSTGQPLCDVVEHVDAAYRVMIQTALEAGEAAAAQSLFDELVAVHPQSQGDIRILGLFALERAKKDDWDAVRAYFQTAHNASAAQSDGRKGFALDADKVAVPIIKEHIKRHSIAETEALIKVYINDMGVPVNREMVTLLANAYGALGDAPTFMGWLSYCAGAGFTVDAAFSNAIVHNCRRHWKFNFRDLRTIYRKLKVLSPDFDDRVTQTIMKHSAISDAKHAGAPVKGRVLSLRIPPPPAPPTWAPPELVMGRRRQHFVDEDDLHVAMKEHFASGHPAKVVRMFTEAMRQGMPPSAKCLALAVSAAVRSGREKKQRQRPRLGDDMSVGSEFDLAIDLVRSAHRAGHCIGDATAYLAIAHIDSIDCRANDRHAHEHEYEHAYRSKASVATAVKTVLTQLGEQNYHISGLALNRAAFFLYKSSHLRGALALAQSAAYASVADDGGGGLLGYDAYNFSILVSVYARMGIATGIRTATDGAVKAGALEDSMAYKAIKQARRRLRAALDKCNAPDEPVDGDAPLGPLEIALNAEVKSARRKNAAAALLEIERTLELARTARKKLAEYRAEVGPGVISLMQRAAEAAGRAPVNFDEIPYLRKNAAKWAKTATPEARAGDWADLEPKIGVDYGAAPAPL